jgi:hypothetical protein
MKNRNIILIGICFTPDCSVKSLGRSIHSSQLLSKLCNDFIASPGNNDEHKSFYTAVEPYSQEQYFARQTLNPTGIFAIVN